MDVNLQMRNIHIILGVFLALSVLIALIQTWKWFSRTERIVIDLQVKDLLFYEQLFHLTIDSRSISSSSNQSCRNNSSLYLDWNFHLVFCGI